MYTSLNSPSKLTGWKSSGGDPCGDSWFGIKCKGSSVTEMYFYIFLVSADYCINLYLPNVENLLFIHNTKCAEISESSLLCAKTIYRNLSDLGLTGSMGYQLSSLTSVTNL